VRVGIIGAGLGGVACAVNLARAGLHDVEVFEQADGPGGVWWANTYPGCEVDVDSQVYSYSFLPHDWTRTHAGQEEVQRYVERVIDHFGVRDRIRFGVRVAEVCWDARSRTYRLGTSAGEAGPFDLVVSCVGMLSNPAVPAWPGLDGFGGPVFHTSSFDHSVDLRGARVALVGTGSTACQLAPRLAEVAAHLDVYQREAGYVLPKRARDFTLEERERYRRRPLARRVDRYRLWHAATKATRAFTVDSPEQERIRAYHARFLARTVEDPAVRAALTPAHPYGCKRPVFASDFYPLFNRPDVRLVPHAVERVTPGGLVAADGVERPADVIVLATGFQASRYLAGLEVRGPGGRTLHEVWGDEPAAFLGMTVAGFPNFAMTYGPNTNGGWSIVAQLERQSEVVVRMARRLARARRPAVLDTRPAVAAWYDRAVQRGLHRRRDASEAGCHTYFRAPTGKNVTQWPYSHLSYLAATKVLPPLGLTRSA